MIKRKTYRLVKQGEYAAEVPVELIERDNGWSPTLSTEDVRKLETVRTLLDEKRLKEAAGLATVYRLTRISP